MTTEDGLKPRRGPTVRTDRDRARAKKKFLERLAESCNVSDSARVAGIARSTAHDGRAADGEFEKAWDEAVEVARDALEAEARRRGVDGWDEPVYQQGQPVGMIRRYSDRLLELLLKGHRPQFRDRGVEVNVGVEAPSLQTPERVLEAARRVAALMSNAQRTLPDPGKALPHSSGVVNAEFIEQQLPAYSMPRQAAPAATPAEPAESQPDDDMAGWEPVS